MDTAAVAIKQDLPSVAPADFVAVKARQRVAWSSGDYAVVGTTLQIVGEELAEALDLRSGQRVLDVAAGNGNASSRRGAPRVPGDVDRLCAGTAGTRRRTRCGRPPVDRFPRSGCREPAVRRRRLRRRDVDVRCDVHAGPGPCRLRADARLSPRRENRPRQLDTRRLHRSSCSARSARSSHRRPGSVRPRCGERVPGSTNCSAGTPARSGPRNGTSCSAISLRRTGSTSSSRTTGRCSRRLRRSMRRRRPRSRTRSSG